MVAIVEIANELSADGVAQVHDPNLGGTVTFEWGSVKLVPAWHTSTTPKGTVNTPAGLIVRFAGKTIYHLGDTALFSDLKLIAESEGGIDVALVCIGGHYTMDRHDAVACRRADRGEAGRSPATTTRSRRSRPTRRRSSPRSSRPGYPRSSCWRPGRASSP